MISKSQLQQLKSILTDRINELEQERSAQKRLITALVSRKKLFVKAGQKQMVDQMNDSIRTQYNTLSSIAAKIAKVVDLQKTVKFEIAYPDAEPVGWQDNVMESDQDIVEVLEENADQVAAAVAQTAVWPFPTGFGIATDQLARCIPQPEFRTLELRPEDRGIRIGSGLRQDGMFPDITSKPTNPKDAIGSGKLPLHLWPNTATAMGSIGMLNGMLKYGRSNFRAIGIRASIYYDAAKRHLDAWFEGEEVDPDDGVPHLSAALACLAIIVDAQAAGKFTDDRAVSGGWRKMADDLTAHVARLKALHASKAPKHYTIADNATV